MPSDYDVYGTHAVDLQELLDCVAGRLLRGVGCCAPFRELAVQLLDRDMKMLGAYRTAVDAAFNDSLSDASADLRRARTVRALTKRVEVEVAAAFWHRIHVMEVWECPGD